MRKLFIAGIVFAIILSSCVPAQRDAKTAKPYAPETYTETDPEPESVRITGNPLDYAGKRLGIDVRNFELPRAYENSYRFTARFQLIDQVSNNPLYMKQWLEDVSADVMREQPKGVGSALKVALRELRGTEKYPEGMYLPREACHMEHRAVFANGPFTMEFEQLLDGLYRALVCATALREIALAELTPYEIEWLEENPGYYIAPDGKRMPPLTGDNTTHLRYIELIRKVSFKHIFYASEIVANAVTYFVNHASKLERMEIFSAAATSILSFNTPLGRVLVLDSGNDEFRGPAALVVDLGGDDIYTGPLATSLGKSGAGICIDLGGNDTYKGGSYGQGFGFLGTGCLVDVSGNDTYIAKNFSQGAGIAGVGILWDLAGDDIYSAHAFNQGAGAFGVGLLLDDNGNDKYDSATLGQGGATTMGIGLISDLEGNDEYKLAVTKGKDRLGSAGYGQGGALSWRDMPWWGSLTAYGGAGVLVDGDGDDNYLTKGWCDQGGSYIMSLGALYDHAGNDSYKANTGQGSGIHITNAILIDRAGDDKYRGGFRTGAAGGDRSPGILIDYSGNDEYRSSKAGYGNGCKPFSFSLFIDYEGDDKYITNRPKGKILFNDWDSFGGVWPESEPYNWPYAICLDLDGEDTYDVRNRANDSERHSMGHGIHLDTKWGAGDVIGTVEAPNRDFAEADINLANSDDPYERLRSPDNFERFNAVGEIADTRASYSIVANLLDSQHRLYNRDLMAALHLKAWRAGEMDSAVFDLLKAADPEVRAVAAADATNWKIADIDRGIPYSVRGLQDEDHVVRAYCYRFLRSLNAPDALKTGLRHITEDPDESVRRNAMLYVAQLCRPEGDREHLAPRAYERLTKAFSEDPEEGPRCVAARMLRHFATEENRDEIVTMLKAQGRKYERSGGQNPYLLRACGKTLAELGEVEGIDFLITSLEFPSIDAFYNYNYNVPNFISAYCGYDLPEDKRYELSNWRKWFDTNRDRIDVAKNAELYNSYREVEPKLRGMESEERIVALEHFLEEHPGYLFAKRRLARELNSVAWNMVTAPKDSDRYDSKQGLKYAKRCCELQPLANYLDTLAEAYEANGMIKKAEEVCKKALEKYPDNKMFLNRLKKYGEGNGE